jgi:hypothetical protein
MADVAVAMFSARQAGSEVRRTAVVGGGAVFPQAASSAKNTGAHEKLPFKPSPKKRKSLARRAQNVSKA